MMPNDRMEQLQRIRQYHSDRDSLYHAERGPSIFGAVDNPSFACTCAELARLAYTRFENNPAIQAQLTRTVAAGGFSQPAFFWRDGAQGFAVRAPNGQQFIAFRGTETDDVRDVIRDVERLPVPFGHYPGKVHFGFAQALEAIWPEVEQWLGKNTPLPPVVTGHSLGAAMATLAAARIPDAQLVTFGSPRVGNRTFSESFAARTVARYVDCCDAVTLVPLEEGLDYKHVGPMIYIDREGEVRGSELTVRAIEGDRLHARVWYGIDEPWYADKVLLREFADHAPANYIRALLVT